MLVGCRGVSPPNRFYICRLHSSNVRPEATYNLGCLIFGMVLLGLSRVFGVGVALWNGCSLLSKKKNPRQNTAFIGL